MAWIPKDAKWYLADIVKEFRVEGEDHSLVHINLLLIRANSPEEAYERALEVGKQGENVYQNVDGKNVVVTFRGLRGLYVVHDELEHGSELIYEEIEDIDEEQIQKLVRPKAELGVFIPYDPQANLDYMPGDIYRDVFKELEKRMGDSPSEKS